MFYIEIAKLLVQVNNHYDLIRQQCQPYLVEPHREPDLVMEADEKEIAFGKAWFLQHEHTEITDAESEFSRAPFSIYSKLPAFGAMWLHSVLLEMDGEGYAITAPSGYGKSTQGQLWLKAFPDRARIINGDNPIVRKEGEGFVAYGTPFCGKEGYQVNIGVPLKGFCYLKHGETNSIRRMDSTVAFAQLLREYQCRFTPQNQEKYMELLQHFAETVPVYVLTCNLDGQAPIVAYEGMKHGGN
ncbi:MAG: hypothetical protein ACLUE8_09830 [Lachnospiraceae bacterium]